MRRLFSLCKGHLRLVGIVACLVIVALGSLAASAAYLSALQSSEAPLTITVQNESSTSPALVVIDCFGDNDTQYMVWSGQVEPGSLLVLTGADLPELPAGFVGGCVVSSDQDVDAVVRLNSNDDGDRLALYRGVENATTSQYFGPVFQGAAPGNPLGLMSTVRIMDGGFEGANVDLQFLNLDGTTATLNTVSVPAGGVFECTGTCMPPNFVGWLAATSVKPITGVVAQRTSDGRVDEVQPQLSAGALHLDLPRAMKGFVEGGNARSTSVFLGNAGDSQASANVKFTGPSGTAVHATDLTVPPRGGAVVDLRQIPQLTLGGVWNLTVSSDSPLAFSELTTGDSRGVSAAAYGLETGYTLRVPRLVHSSTWNTAFSLSNPGDAAADVTISYYGTDGSVVATQTASVPAGGYLRLSQAAVAGLGTEFEGGALVSSNAPVAVWVDEFDHTAFSLSGVSPNAVSASSPTTITVAGQGFIPGATVRLGPSTTLATTYLSDLTLTATVPAGLPGGSYDVTVDNEDGSSATLPSALRVDATPPVISSLAINGGAVSTVSPNVTLWLNAYDPTYGTVGLSMRFSNDGTTWSGWQPYAASSAWTLAQGDGAKTVYAQCRDAVGNESSPAIAGIVLDTTAGPGPYRLFLPWAVR